MSLIEIAKSKSEKLFAFFIDFKAAFDSVNWQALYYKLSSAGVSTKFIFSFSNIYNGAKCRIWTRDGLIVNLRPSPVLSRAGILSHYCFLFH